MEISGITLSVTDTWMLSGCGALVLLLVGYRLNAELSRQNSFRTAANDFRSVFTETLSMLKDIDATGNTVEEVLKERHFAHRKAAAEFREFLPPSTRNRFDGDWYRFHSGHSIDDQSFSAYEWGWEKIDGLYLEYSPYFIGNGIPRINDRNTAIMKTENLIKYATHK